MSYPLLRLVALSAHPLLRRSARCRAVLGYMAERADHDGRGVYPAVGSIARDTLIDARDVSRAINSLKKAGLVVDVAAPLGQTVNRRINVTDLAGWAPPSIENRDRIDGWGQTHGL
ncbi:MAG: helix-turn-helix domain-containing protein, partial [Rhodocyclaceae bacterium]